VIVASAPAATPTAPPSSASVIASQRNCVRIWPRVARASEPDLRATLEHRDDHDVRHPDGADEQRDGAEAEE
jgi:hypothetical protein